MAEPKPHITLAAMSSGKRIRRMVAGSLYCTACKDWRPKDDFPTDLRMKFSRRSICKKAALELQRKRRRVLRRKRSVQVVMS
jgi:hypothetical protein